MPQIGSLKNKLLQKILAAYGFSPTPRKPGLWRHEIRPINTDLVVDDFGVEYEQKEYAQNLLNALNRHYEAVAEDWEVKIFCAINLEWDYKQRTLDLKIPGYVKKVMHKYQHNIPIRSENQPHRHNPPEYGKNIKYEEAADVTPPLNKDEIG